MSAHSLVWSSLFMIYQQTSWKILIHFLRHALECLLFPNDRSTNNGLVLGKQLLNRILCLVGIEALMLFELVDQAILMEVVKVRSNWTCNLHSRWHCTLSFCLIVVSSCTILASIGSTDRHFYRHATLVGDSVHFCFWFLHVIRSNERSHLLVQVLLSLVHQVWVCSHSWLEKHINCTTLKGVVS